MTEKICATTNAVFLEEAERYSPKESGKNRCNPQVVYPAPTTTNGPCLHLASLWKSSAIGPGRVAHETSFPQCVLPLGGWSTNCQIFW